MFSGINMNRLMGGAKPAGGVAGVNNKATGGKRKAEVSPTKIEPKKRSALGDLTNAVKRKGGLGGNKQEKPEKLSLKAEAPKVVVVTRARSKSLIHEEPQQEAPKADLKHPEPLTRNKNVQKDLAAVKDKLEKVQNGGQVSKLPVRQTRSSRSRASETVKEDEQNDTTTLPRRMTTRSSHTRQSTSVDSTSTEDENSLLFTTAISSPDWTAETISSQEVDAQNRKNEELSLQQKMKLPDGVVDFDAETGNDPFQVGLYAEDIFAYYMRRETRFHVKKYLDKQTELNRNMRSILIDWMVEVQESFELNHETMYLGVKLVDLFLSKVHVKREQLQLVGTTALYVSAKYDERCPPLIDDFCYICDDAYPQKEIIKMERKILRTLNYDIGFPLSYRFLRRYSRCAKLDMDTLTLARYILEMSLMEYDFIDVKDSMMASSSLLLALVMKGIKDPWTKTLEHYSGYTKEDIFDLTHRLHAYLSSIPAHLKTIRSKYSHKVFYESAKVPLPDVLNL